MNFDAIKKMKIVALVSNRHLIDLFYNKKCCKQVIHQSLRRYGYEI